MTDRTSRRGGSTVEFLVGLMLGGVIDAVGALAVKAVFPRPWVFSALLLVLAGTGLFLFVQGGSRRNSQVLGTGVGMLLGVLAALFVMFAVGSAMPRLR